MLLRRVSKAAPLPRRLFCSRSGDLIAGAVEELNKEMESVFGEPPPSTVASANNGHLSRLEHWPGVGRKVAGLTHVGPEGDAQMVDVSPKGVTRRVAAASGRVILGKEAFDLVSANRMAKGDVLAVAKVAGISGAKQTSSLIPLCHNIGLTHVRVDLALDVRDFSVRIEGEAASTGRTGAEMEAMTAVAVAGLTVYDMCKAASRDIRIAEIRLERKSGGRSRDWSREDE